MAKKEKTIEDITINSKDFKKILNSLTKLGNGEFDTSIKSKDKKVNSLMKKINNISKNFNTISDDSNLALEALGNGNLDNRIDTRKRIMENLNIETTKYTPKVTLNTNGTLSMVGKSYPENVFAFYSPIMSWMKTYLETTKVELTVINFDISYINSGSSKQFYSLFKLLQELNNNVEINWIFDKDNDMSEEAGEEFIEDFEDLNIKLIYK